MPHEPVDYDAIAATYNRRYEANPMQPVADTLNELAGSLAAQNVLEAGCGTGRWLADLAAPGRALYGLDASRGMLHGAAQRGGRLNLVHGRAESLPFRTASFDFVYAVNALHHFADRLRFVQEARRVLRPGGALAVIGTGRVEQADWCVYEYFEGTLALDRARFPTPERLGGWMSASRFEGVESRVVYEIDERFVGRDVFASPFLEKHATSQLVLLSDEAYAAGLQRMEETIAAAEAAGEQAEFRSRLELVMVLGRVPAG